MLRRTPLTRIAVPAAAALAVGLTLPALYANADATAAEDCVQAGNVWVNVAYDETETGACATEFEYAQDAITSAGVSEDVGWIQTVDGRLAADKEWWSVYSLAPNEDGTYPAEWDFAQVGAAELALAPSSVLAMQLQEDWELDAVAPATNPVEGVVLSGAEEETPAPAEPTESAPEPTESAPEPTVSASPEPTNSAAPAPSRATPPKTGN